MGFRKPSKSESVLASDFKWRGSQIWVMADWMGVLRQCQAAKKTEDRVAILKAACEADTIRAQKGYEFIVLMKEPAVADGSKLPEEMEQRMYGVLNTTINAHKDALGDTATRLVGEAVAIERKALVEFAKREVSAAADRKAPLVVKVGSKSRKVSGVLPPEFARMVQLASARIPLVLVGPAGCGKTYLCGKLAEALGVTFSDQSCSEGMSEAVFNGSLLPIGKGGEFKHVASPFMERYEEGGVMLLDEIDAGDPNLFTYINKAVANESYTAIQRFSKPVVKKSKDFILVAAANTYGNGADSQYVGRNQLDAATMDRFRVGMITMDYSREVESSLAPEEVCSWAWSIRDKIRANKLKRIMSTRVIQNIATMTEMHAWTKLDWEACYFADWSVAERRLVTT